MRRGTAFAHDPGMLAALHLLLLPVWLAAPSPATPTSVAIHGERLLLGTERGLYQNGPDGWALILTRGGVRDLASANGHLLIATGAGLYHWRSGADRPAKISLGAGARIRAVASDRLDTEWVAAESGLYTRVRGAARFRRERSLPTGAVTSVRASSAGVWVAMQGAIWRRGEGEDFERVLRGLEAGWWELRGAVDVGEGSLLCVPRGLWRIDGEGARRLELGVGELRGIVRAGSTLWVASERGAYPIALSELERGVPQAAVHADAVALVRSGDRLVVATRRGVASLELSAAPAPVLALKGLAVERTEIRSLHRTVLAYLDISPRRIAAIEKRARRSAWLPEVRATLSLDRERTRDSDHDEVFSSGRVRNLFDSASERENSVGLDVTFVWKLARSAEPDQALDISRERRQLVELRDQVLERVNRLHFERQRLILRLAALDPGATAERAELAIRAGELGAHLDAWSGGAYSRLASLDAGPQR